MGAWITTGILFVLVIVFITILILVTISLAQVNDNDDDDGAEDKERYSQARTYLGWAIGIGWALVGLGILIIILGAVALFVLLPGTIATLAIPNVGGKGSAVGTGIIEFEKYRKKIRSGLFGFRAIFNTSGLTGFLLKAALIASLILLFVFGILAALAATEIGRTTTKRGYSQAIWAAVLGIIPLSGIIIWAIGNFFYVRAEKNRALDLAEQVSVKLAEEQVKPKAEAVAALPREVKPPENITQRKASTLPAGI